MNSKDLLSVADLDAPGIRRLISQAVALKADGWSAALNEKTLVLIFEKPSLRTRVSFELAMRQLGGQSLYLSPEEVGMGTREAVPDAARVLSRFADVIAARTFSHATVATLAANADVPVINALSDYEHPCQALADLLTIYEKKQTLAGLTVAYIGDGNNCANSLLLAAALTGMNCRIATPRGYEITSEVMKQAEGFAAASGSAIISTEEPQLAAEGADVIYTDVWVSMGQEQEAEHRRSVFAAYQVNEKLLSLAKDDALLMHPLPAHHGEEVAVNIIYSPQSVVFDQAENRLYAQKALLAELLAK